MRSRITRCGTATTARSYSWGSRSSWAVAGHTQFNKDSAPPPPGAGGHTRNRLSRQEHLAELRMQLKHMQSKKEELEHYSANWRPGLGQTELMNVATEVNLTEILFILWVIFHVFQNYVVRFWNRKDFIQAKHFLCTKKLNHLMVISIRFSLLIWKK